MTKPLNYNFDWNVWLVPVSTFLSVWVTENKRWKRSRRNFVGRRAVCTFWCLKEIMMWVKIQIKTVRRLWQVYSMEQTWITVSGISFFTAIIRNIHQHLGSILSISVDFPPSTHSFSSFQLPTLRKHSTHPEIQAIHLLTGPPSLHNLFIQLKSFKSILCTGVPPGSRLWE